MKPLILTNQAADFYQRMGPFLGNRAVIKAIGYALYDDAGKHWHLVMDGEVVKGFCYTWPRGSKLDVGSFYPGVATDAEAVAHLLAKSIISHMQPGKAVITTRIAAAVSGAKKAGFKGKLPKNGFTHLEFTKP